MNGWKYKLYRFMQGRRGLDNLGKFLLISAIVLMVIAMFLGRIPVAYYITYYLGLILFIYAYFRAFSRNLYRGRRRTTAILLSSTGLQRAGPSASEDMKERYTPILSAPDAARR